MESTGFSAKLLAFLSGFSGVTAYAVILGVLFACGLGVPIPEDITLLAAGILAALDKISLVGAFIAGMVGVLFGDCFLFFLGRKLGRRVFELPIFKKIFSPQRISMAEQKILNNSMFICFTARFLPGLRSPIFLTAGMMGVRPIIFLTLDGFAALISVPVWIAVGYWFGKNMDEALTAAKDIQIVILIAVATLIIGYLFFKRKRKKALKPPQSPQI